MTPQESARRARAPQSVLRLCAAGILALPCVRAEIEGGLEEIVVSASRFSEPAEKTTAAVTVLDPRDLTERGIFDLQTALAESPGVISVSTSGQAGAIGSLFIRGMKTASSQIVVDGMRLSDSSAPLGNFLGTARVDDLSRIEVLRGPQSAMYGGEAAGGVVWLETGRGEGKPGGNARFEAGSHDSYSGAVSSHGSQGAVSWFAGGGYDATANDVRNNHWDQGRAAARIEWQANSDITVGATLRAIDSRYENPSGSIDHLDSVLGTLYANVRFSESWTSSNRIGIYDEKYDSDSAPWAAFDTGNFGTDLTRTAFYSDHSLVLDDCHKLLFGGFFENSDYQNTIGTDEDENRYGGYLGWRYTPGERLAVDATARWEDYADYGDEVTWRTGAAYKIPGAETILRGGIGRAFRAPGFSDIHGSQFAAGNPDIDAESSIGYDIGLEKEYVKNHSAAVTWFSSAIDDTISYDANFRAMNVAGTTHAEGIETALHGTFSDGMFAYRLAYTHLAMSLADQPENSGTASIDFRPTEKLLIGISGSYLDERSWGGLVLEDVFIARIYGSYQVNDHVKLTARVENVFDNDWKYADFSSSFGPNVVKAPGLGAFAGVEFAW